MIWTNSNQSHIRKIVHNFRYKGSLCSWERFVKQTALCLFFHITFFWRGHNLSLNRLKSFSSKDALCQDGWNWQIDSSVEVENIKVTLWYDLALLEKNPNILCLVALEVWHAGRGPPLCWLRAPEGKHIHWSHLPPLSPGLFYQQRF